jgi:hypothetical protein
MAGEDLKQLTDAELLSRVIKRSGMTLRSFAINVLVRDQRAVRRMLDGELPLPKEVRRRLEHDEASPAELRQLLRQIADQHEKGGDLTGLVARARELAGSAGDVFTSDSWQSP